MSTLKVGVNQNISNAEYHADKAYLSSTGLKLLLDNSLQFHREYILGRREVKKSDAFDEGSLVHSLILEPHKVQEEYAFYQGERRKGKQFDEFLATVPGKIVLLESQKIKCERLAQAALESALISDLLSGGESEHTVTGYLESVPIKVRCDYINIEQNYIADIKTTASPSGTVNFENTVQRYVYDLSGALYSWMCEQHYGKPFDFYYVVISKADGEARVYQSPYLTMREGQNKVKFALQRYKNCLQTNDWSHILYRPLVRKSRLVELKDE